MVTLAEAHTHLLDVLNKLGQADHADHQLVLAHCRLQSFDSGRHLYRPGQAAKDVYFVHSGLVRVFNVTDSGHKEFNKSFVSEGQFVGPLVSPLRTQASPYHIQTLEHCEVLVIARAALDELYQRSIVWANIGRLYMEHLAITKEQREAQLLTGTAEQRYVRFLRESPQLIDRVPLYHIASYLGVTDVALSRIRRRLNPDLLNPG